MRRPRYLVDANVLVDAQLRDVFLGLDEAGHIEAFWSGPILTEMRTALVDKIGLSPDGAGRVSDAIRASFAGREVVLVDVFPSLPLTPDPDDQHVLAAAVVGEADVIVTFDRRGFPEAARLEALDLDVLSPDHALVEVVESVGPMAVLDVLRTIRALRTNPAITAEAQMERLAARCPDLAEGLRDREDGDPIALTAVELIDDATAALHDVAALIREDTAHVGQLTELLNTEAANAAAARSRGGSGGRDRARIAAGVRIDRARSVLADEKMRLETARSNCWEQYRTSTTLWLEIAREADDGDRFRPMAASQIDTR